MSRAVAIVRGALVVALLVLPVTVAADARTEARRHFRRGMELVVEGTVDGGVAELELAYEILPHPNVLYNIARAYAENGRYDDALEYFERYLASDPPDREEVRQVLAAIEQRIASRDALTAGPTTPSTDGQTTEPTTGVSVSSTEIQALRDAATQIATLAEVSQWPASRWEQQVAAIATFVAVSGGEDVGVVRGIAHPDVPDAREVIGMWVDPRARRRSVGTALMRAVCEWARGDGARTLVLDVIEGNGGAIAFYAGLGFERYDGSAFGVLAAGEIRMVRTSFGGEGA